MDFPRGGQTETSGSSSRDPLTNSLFKSKRTMPSTAPKSNKRPRGLVLDPGLDSELVGLGHLKGGSFIEPINFKRTVPGCLVIGYVLRIGEESAMISIPGGLTGVLPYAEISDTLKRRLKDDEVSNTKELPVISSILQLHQCVRCCVLSSSETDKKLISLTMRSSIVNKGLSLKHIQDGSVLQGSVASQEDHGYTVDIGVRGVTAFLPFKKVTKGVEYAIGCPIECIVETNNLSSKTLMLRVKPTKSSQVITQGALSFANIQCGMLFNCVVQRVVEVRIWVC